MTVTPQIPGDLPVALFVVGEPPEEILKVVQGTDLVPPAGTVVPDRPLDSDVVHLQVQYREQHVGHVVMFLVLPRSDRQRPARLNEPGGLSLRNSAFTRR